MRNILFPSVQDLSNVPPVINAINYLATFERVTVFTYFINKNQLGKSVTVHSVSKVPYPKTKMSRQVAKLKSWTGFYKFLLKHANDFDFIWLGVWDYVLVKPVLRMAGYKGEVIYQLNEMEFNQFKYCRKVDHVLVPDENRGWIAYFLAGLKNRPLVLPNIPFLPSTISFNKETELSKIRSNSKQQGVKIVLYQGHIDYKKRCIRELLMAFKKLPDNIIMVIMPGNHIKKNLDRIHADIAELNIANKVFVINNVKAPEHLVTIQQADLGIGLYRPTSLNQIYAAPNRLYEFTKFGIPLILPNFPAFKALAIKYPFAINTVDPESIDGIAEVIRNTLEAPNYTEGRRNAEKFTQREGKYEVAFDDCWNKIANKASA